MPGRQVPLRIKSLASMANANQVYQMRLALREQVEDITPGMSVMVYVNYGEGKQSNEVLVPAGALWAQAQQSYVYRFDEETSQSTAVPVTVDNFRPDGNAIISNGLSDGDLVVASGIHHLADGQKVRRLTDPAEVIIEK